MLHYSCDFCQRKIDPEEDVRYVVKLEVYPVVEPTDETELDEDRDHLQEINAVLERLDDRELENVAPVFQKLHFDLCPECRRRFMKDPLGRDVTKHLQFSAN